VRTRILTAATVALAAAATVLPAALTPSAVEADAAVPARRIVHHEWDTTAQLKRGSARGLVVRKGSLVFSEPAGTDGRYEYARWVSPWTSPGFDLTELVPSWVATTPGDSWTRIEVRGRNAGGRGSWDTISDWALDDDGLRRTSGTSQTDDLGRVAYDTWITGGASAYRLRVTVHRRAGTTVVPRVRSVGAMVSRLPSATGVQTSRPGFGDGAALGTVLPVPRYSQMIHRGSYPQYDGGGQAWCSPTSTTMVLGYYDALPAPREYAWVADGYRDPVVAHLARMTYDTSSGGTGNWPFNTAYAGSKTRKAFVTRLRSLREAERFIAAGIPLVASVTFSAGQLSGAPISSTNGHLMVIVGFTRSGDVVVNDPAAPSRSGVRRTYDRGQFEDAWLKRYASGSSMKGSGGLVYVIRDRQHPLPERGANRNW
jgi:hypothetical protein